MANNQAAQNQALANSVHTAAKHFSLKVSEFLANMTDIVSSPEAMRLTTNLCLKIQAAMDEADKPFTWADINSGEFVTSAARIAMLGLDAMMNECYPIPYKNSKTNKIDIQCNPSAKGMVKLLMLYSAGTNKVTRFKRYVIREGERFLIKHTPGNDEYEYIQDDIFGSKKAVGYVTIAEYDDGTSSVMAHSKADIDKRRAVSKAPNSPAWSKWYDEMALAKAARRHVNELPMALPKLLKEALDNLDDEEQPMKDVTPPTLALDAPQYEDASVATPDPEPAKPVTQARSRTTSAAKAPEAPQIDLGFMNE